MGETKRIKGMSALEYSRRYKADVSLHMCECGQRAVRRKGSGWCCARCHALEEAKAHTFAVSDRLCNTGPLGRQGKLSADEVEALAVGWGSLEELERQLAAVSGGAR